MKDISITEKLILFFVLIGLASIITVGSYSYISAKKALLNRTYDQLISLRLEKKKRVEQFFLDRTRDIKFISESDEMIGMGGSSPIIQIFSSNGYYHQLYLVNPNNSVTGLIPGQENSGKDSTEREISRGKVIGFCEELGKTKSTLIQDITRESPYVYIGRQLVANEDNGTGFVVAEIPVSALNRIMFEQSEYNGLGRTGETYLVGNDSLMRSNSRFTGNAILNTRVNTRAVRQALSGETGFGLIRDYRNISCLSSFSQVSIEGLNWVILAEIDEKEAMTPVYAIRNSILLISIILAAGVFIIALMISLRITAPLKILQRASEQIGEGDYNINLRVSTNDELGRLTRTFNHMVSQLKKQSEEIEEEKTKRISSLLDGQELERQRLARDLHDSLGQSILTANMKLEQARNAGSEKSQLIISETQILLKHIIQDVRSISNDLMPSILATFGIDQGLRNFCKETGKNAGINLVYYGENIPESLNAGVQIYLFRITQESINNIIKHSGATEARIRLNCTPESVSLTISDNGKGFDTNIPMNTGNGIINIRERVKALKGNCLIESGPGTGTSINISIPIE